MVRNADIEYIRHDYTSGNTARKRTVKKQPARAPLYWLRPGKLEPGEKITIKVEVLPIITILAALGLLVLMVLNLFYLSQTHQENVALQEYVYDLRNEQVRLEKTYYEGFNLEEIRVQALALGMIPAVEADILQISGEVPQKPADPTGWERVQDIFRELFANIP